MRLTDPIFEAKGKKVAGDAFERVRTRLSKLLETTTSMVGRLSKSSQNGADLDRTDDRQHHRDFAQRYRIRAGGEFCGRTGHLHQHDSQFARRVERARSARS